MIFSRALPDRERIFVNYRRDDAGGYAGRLSDSLAQYFGADRVFRDVTGIDYGHDFESVIEERLASSGALIVLIGEKWVDVTDSGGRRRLDDPGDYVTSEISGALKSGVAVLPVLIGAARMPRAEELPEKLHPLIRRNAMTITDERWEHDVERLAKVIAIDVPGSVAQRRLDRLSAIALIALFASGLLATLGFCVALIGEGGLAQLRANGFTPLMASIPFFGIVAAGTCTMLAARDIEAAKRNYARAAVAVAVVGTIGTFLYYVVTNNQTPILALVTNFAGAMIVIPAMLALIAMAGFRAK